MTTAGEDRPMSAPQEHPDYHEGFFDAMDGVPIWEDECSPLYAAGWRAYWEVKPYFSDENLIGSKNEALLPADPIFSPSAKLTRH
jgi:hypothetical protein